MADVTDPKIDEAYNDVRSKDSETSWLILDYESDKIDKLHVTQTGTGGLKEVTELLDETKASYAYVRVVFANDKESQREKFILISWIGPKASVMRKAKVSVQLADVKGVLRVRHGDISAGSSSDLNEDAIVKKLRTAGGASYDGV